MGAFFTRTTGFIAGLLTLLALLLAPTEAQAQDIIIDLSGNELTGQVLEVTPTQVIYRTPDTDAALPPSVLDKQTLFMIRFANGTKEVFGVTAPAPTSAPALVGASPAPAGVPALSTYDLYAAGKRDALAYHNYSGAFWGTYAATVTTFYGGPIVGAIVGCSRPSARNNPLLDRTKLQYPAYVDGYERQAQRRKLGEAVKGYGAGLGTWVVIAIVVLSAAFR